MEKTKEGIAQDYTAMGHSVNLINKIIAGTAMTDYTKEERQAAVDRNVLHLEIMKGKEGLPWYKNPAHKGQARF